MDEGWVPAIGWRDLCDRGRALFRHGRERIALFAVDGEVYAVDDRCPHEGYPLTQGAVCGTALTCCFHNYKFDLRDGRCLVGEEAVRAWPVRVVDGVVEVDVRPPDPRAERVRRWDSLRAAVFERRVGQVARDAVRLLALGESPRALLRFAAVWDAERGEYGTTHVLPVAADLVRWLDAWTGLEAAHPAVQALSIAADFHVRRPPRTVPEPVDPGEPATFADRLAAAVEAEDAARAGGLVRGAVAAGWERPVLEPAVLRLCADHFLDYGHALIYAVKAFDLLAACGWEAADPVLPALVHAIVTGTREDVLPAWSGFRRRRAARAASLDGWARGAAAVRDPERLERVLLAGGAGAEEAVAAALDEGAALRDVARVLVVAGARRVLRFDAALDADPAWQDNWLSASHVQTFANAVRHAVGRAAPRDAVRLVFQAARMVAMTAPLDADAPRWREEPALEEARARLADDPGAERRRWMAEALADRSTAPIVVAHGIKQVVAGFDDFEATGREECALAAIRLCAASKQERSVARRTREAIALVADGRIPRRKVG